MEGDGYSFYSVWMRITWGEINTGVIFWWRRDPKKLRGRCRPRLRLWPQTKDILIVPELPSIAFQFRLHMLSCPYRLLGNLWFYFSFVSPHLSYPVVPPPHLPSPLLAKNTYLLVALFFPRKLSWTFLQHSFLPREQEMETILPTTKQLIQSLLSPSPKS